MHLNQYKHVEGLGIQRGSCTPPPCDQASPRQGAPAQFRAKSSLVRQLLVLDIVQSSELMTVQFAGVLTSADRTCKHLLLLVKLLNFTSLNINALKLVKGG